MDGPLSLIGVIGAVQQLDKITGDDLTGIEKLLRDTISEVKGLQAAHDTASTAYAALAQTSREINDKVRAATLKRNCAHLSAYNEIAENPAADAAALAMQLLALDRETEALQDTADFLREVRLPEALDKRQESNRDLCRVLHLEAALHTAFSHASMRRKLDGAGLSKTHGTVVAISETTEDLKRATAEAYRLAQLADQDLVTARAARTARAEQRRFAGQITRAESIYAAVEVSRTVNA